MNKTPQEQAEDKFNAVAQRFDFECMGKLPDYRAELYFIQKQEIPLPELIAVAQAADMILTDYMTYFVDWERMANDKTYKPEYPANVLKAQAALQALRATGKVEL